MDLKLVDLTLERVSDGGLEGRFQELLSEIMGINESSSAYVAGSDGTVTSKITLDVEVRFRPSIGGDPASTLIISGGELKRPKRMKSAQSAHMGEDGNLVVIENPPTQISAFDGEGSGGTVARIDAAANGGSNDGK